MWLYLLACRPPESPVCIGLDADGDGVCDRESADFGPDAEVPPGGRANIYDLDPDTLEAVRESGFRHANQYPVQITGILLPFRAMTGFYDPANTDAEGFRNALESGTGIDSMEGLYREVGLIPYDELGGEVWAETAPDDLPPFMGASIIDTALGEGLTFSCAACHSGRFLGRSVRGLQNRRPRANTFFDLGKNFLPNIPSDAFQAVTGATDDEVAMLERTTDHFDRVGLKEPEALGLDTSLAQVALSLARRADDPDATPDPARERNPVENALETDIADSKPMPWWTLKYKNRWLADGSIVQGNPVHTNFLWNEIGRGIDLQELAAWMDGEATAIDELTVAVFASEPPRWTDFFEASTIDLDTAMRGQTLFERDCAACHGSYEKAWDGPDADALSPEDRLATVWVDYTDSTPVDVGTDLGRANGMEHFGPRLNELAISQDLNTVVEVQRGYVPPPLDGVFARYPYFHNNAVPTLCDVLRPADERPVTFIQGPSESAEDFDASCVGYPVGEAIPAGWSSEATVDTTEPGLSNVGHDGFDYTADERASVITFLKTL